MRILIAGATGAIGGALVRRLRANQQEVFALTRSHDSAAALKEIGAEAVYADALDAAAVRAAVGRIRPDTVINELTSLPRHYTHAEITAGVERDRKVRVGGNINLLAALHDAGLRRYLLQSSGFWYAPGPVHLKRIPGSRGQRRHIRMQRRCVFATRTVPAWKRQIEETLYLVDLPR